MKPGTYLKLPNSWYSVSRVLIIFCCLHRKATQFYVPINVDLSNIIFLDLLNLIESRNPYDVVWIRPRYILDFGFMMTSNLSECQLYFCLILNCTSYRNDLSNFFSGLGMFHKRYALWIASCGCSFMTEATGWCPMNGCWMRISS